jgi:caa(3)-type oxidase subunit IV
MSNHEEIGHVIPKSTVVGSYFALLFLVGLMVGLSRIDVARLGIDWIDLHAVRTTIIMGIALVCGLIVSMFLMGLRYESKLLNLTVFLSNFVFLLIFVLFTWVDTSFRGEVDPSFTQKINFISPVKESAGEHGAVTQEAAPMPSHETSNPAEAKPAADSVKQAAPTSQTAPAPQAAPAAAQPTHSEQKAAPPKEAAPAH